MLRNLKRQRQKPCVDDQAEKIAVRAMGTKSELKTTNHLPSCANDIHISASSYARFTPPADVNHCRQKRPRVWNRLRWRVSEERQVRLCRLSRRFLQLESADYPSLF
jgi:hypothetical protein